jgi:hypothetical protein
MRSRTLALVVFLTLCFSRSLFADTIVIGAPGDGLNAFPFGGHVGAVGTRYQQAYSSSQFSGPILINSISFLGGNSGPLGASTYAFSLSTITAGIDSLSPFNFDANRGANNQLFANVGLSGPGPATLTITGLTPFLYNPAQGNLLLDIVVTPGGVPASGLVASYSSRTGTANGIFSRYQNYGGGTIGWGLVTRFDFTPAAVPEPAVLTLLATGILSVIGFGLRKQR